MIRSYTRLWKTTIFFFFQIAGFNGLSEAVRRLDFSSAVRDVRRFNYICALLELLVGGQRLTHLPGAAQKLLLSMLEQLADQGEGIDFMIFTLFYISFVSSRVRLDLPNWVKLVD